MMAATVVINEWTSPGTITDKTSGEIRFKNANNSTVDLVNPLVVPTSLREYSFEKYIRLQITDEGGFTQIDNLRAYSDNSGWTGHANVKCWYAVTGAFDTPAVPDENNDPPQSTAAGSPQEDMADFFGSSSGSPIDMDAINTGPFTNGSPTEHIGDFLVLVCEVEIGATAGILATELLTAAYDEI
jgi:hypothetical protein